MIECTKLDLYYVASSSPFAHRQITWYGLLYIFECLFNLYNFLAGDKDKDKDKVKCTLRFQCIEYLV